MYRHQHQSRMRTLQAICSGGVQSILSIFQTCEEVRIERAFGVVIFGLPLWAFSNHWPLLAEAIPLTHQLPLVMASTTFFQRHWFPCTSVALPVSPQVLPLSSCPLCEVWPKRFTLSLHASYREWLPRLQNRRLDESLSTCPQLVNLMAKGPSGWPTEWVLFITWPNGEQVYLFNHEQWACTQISDLALVILQYVFYQNENVVHHCWHFHNYLLSAQII